MDKILSFLGMCKKAGALEIGDETVGAATKKGKAFLIITASDAAANTSKKAARYAERGKNALIMLPYTKQELGDMLGKSESAILAVTNLSMATELVKKLSAEHGKYYEQQYEMPYRLNSGENGQAGRNLQRLKGSRQDKSIKGGM